MKFGTLRFAALAALVGLGMASAWGQDAAAPKQDTGVKPKPVIEIAVLLDTSGSMQGLIDQARARLWAIVNSLATTRKDGVRPELRVALYEYGKSSLPRDTMWIRQIVPLSDDLDLISKELFALTTNGGEEYCGAAIKRAVEELAWTPGDQFRAIFIAGNEPFTQGPVDYRDACKAAISKGITVNTIHCGNQQQAEAGKWIDGARLADGQSINIDHTVQSVGIAAPQDGRIAELNGKLNSTYVPFGADGKGRAELQEKLDKQAESAQPGGAGQAQRAMAKSSGYYRANTWDLVDAVRDGKVELDSIKDEELPEEMRKMTPEERKAFVETKGAERAKLQEEIRQLAAEREKYVTEERKKNAEAGARSFDEAVQDMLKGQLEKKGYARDDK
jgi:hypothetical protein